MSADEDEDVIFESQLKLENLRSGVLSVVTAWLGKNLQTAHNKHQLRGDHNFCGWQLASDLVVRQSVSSKTHNRHNQSSALHQHLVNTGYTDFESVKLCSIQNQEELHGVKSKGSLLLQLKKSFKYFKEDVAAIFKEDGRATTLLWEILGCPLLLEEDAHWLRSTAQAPSQTRQQQTNSAGSDWWLEMWGSGLGRVLLFPAGAMLSLSAIECWWKQRQHHARLISLRQLLLTLRSVTRDMRRAFVLIQEHQIIQHGFFMAQSGTSAWRLEKPDCGRPPSLPALRSTLATTLRATVAHVRSSSRRLRALQPLCGRADTTYYLAEDETVSLEQEKDELSLATLKRLLQLHVTLQSELLRRLALCLWPQPGTPRPIAPVIDACRDLTHVLLPLCDELALELRLARTVGSRSAKVTTPCPAVPRLLDVYVTLHSATLHVQALLGELLDAEEMSQHVLEYTTLLNRVSVSRAHLLATDSCLREAELRLLKLSQPSEPSESVIFLPTQDPSLSVPQIIPVGYTDLEPRGKDQVFEAESCQELMNLTDSEGEDETWSVRRVEQEVSRRLYYELQSVLAVRAEDWRVREARALGKTSEQLEPSTDVGEPREQMTAVVNVETSTKQPSVDMNFVEPSADLNVQQSLQQSLNDVSVTQETFDENVSQPLEQETFHENVSQPLEQETFDENVSLPLEQETFDENVSQSLEQETFDENVSQPLEQETFDENVSQPLEQTADVEHIIGSSQIVLTNGASWPLARLPQRPRRHNKYNYQSERLTSDAPKVRRVDCLVKTGPSLALAQQAANKAREFSQLEETFGDDEEE